MSCGNDGNNDYNHLKIENQLCFPLYVASKEIVRKYKPFLDEINLTYTQYIAMMIMWEYKVINVKDLGEKLYLDSGTLTPLLKKLESKGYITRNRCDVDARSLIISITKEGEELKLLADGIPSNMRKCLNVSDEDLINMRMLIDKLIETVV